MGKLPPMSRHSAYTDLLMRHRNMLWRMCWQRAGGNRDRCCDLMQEVSLTLWEHFDKLRPDASDGQERAWVRWQARSVFYQQGRRHTMTAVPLSEAMADNLSDADRLQRKETLEDLLSALDADEQQMMRLYLDGYRGDEIGEAMRISRDSYYQRMHRAIQKIRRLALILVALLLTSTIAVAVVPSWRRQVFGGGEPKGLAVDSVPEQTPPAHKAVKPVDTVQADASAEQVSAALDRTLYPMVELTTMEPLGPVGPAGEVKLLASSEELSVTLDGTRLIVIGAQGELVRIYDGSGRLINAQKTNGFCFFDLSPIFDFLAATTCYEYTLQVGSRAPMRVRL